jgi:hypothetical protein
MLMVDCFLVEERGSCQSELAPFFVRDVRQNEKKEGGVREIIYRSGVAGGVRGGLTPDR